MSKRPQVAAAFLLAFVFLVVTLGGCGRSSKAVSSKGTVSNEAVAQVAAPSQPVTTYDRAGTPPVVGQRQTGGTALAVETVGFDNRKVIKNAEMNLLVEDLVETMRRLETRVESLGGLVADGAFTASAKGENRANMTLRVPANHFASLLAEIEGLGKVLTKRIYSNDVTKDYLDLEARITNLQRSEDRLLQILAQARAIDEILKVEGELERVRGQIEAYTGQLNFLKDRVNYSTINLTLQVNNDGVLLYSPKGAVWERSARAFRNSVDWLTAFSGNLLVILFGFFPIALVMGALLIAGWYWRRRYLGHRSKSPSPPGHASKE